MLGKGSLASYLTQLLDSSLCAHTRRPLASKTKSKAKSKDKEGQLGVEDSLSCMLHAWSMERGVWYCNCTDLLSNSSISAVAADNNAARSPLGDTFGPPTLGPPTVKSQSAFNSIATGLPPSGDERAGVCKITMNGTEMAQKRPQATMQAEGMRVSRGQPVAQRARHKQKQRLRVCEWLGARVSERVDAPPAHGARPPAAAATPPSSPAPSPSKRTLTAQCCCCCGPSCSTLLCASPVAGGKLQGPA